MKSGISAINEFEPDLVLLDIKLKDGSGFELIDHFIFSMNSFNWINKGYNQCLPLNS